LRPSNPYSASKAGGDLLALAYWQTHRVPVVITRSSNNFGPYQYPEKVVPLFITNALEDEPSAGAVEELATPERSAWYVRMVLCVSCLPFSHR